MLKLENWNIETVYFEEDPSSYLIRMTGDLYNSGEIKDGFRITTNRVLSMDMINNRIRTDSRIYELGEPNIELKEWLSFRGKTIKTFHQEEIFLN